MRIGLIAPAYSPALDFGGPLTKMMLLAQHLKEVGSDVMVLTSDFGLGRSRVKPGTREVDGVPVTYLRRVAAYRWSPVVTGVAAHLTANPLDVAHLFGYRDGVTLAAGRALRQRNTPMVIEPLGMVTRRGRNRVAKAAVDATVGRRYLDSASVIIAASQIEADDLATAKVTPTVVVRPNPVRLQPIAPEPDPARTGFRILFVGRLAPIKALPVLVEAVAAVAGATLRVVGPVDTPSAGDKLDATIALLGMHDRVTRGDGAWGVELAREFADADCLVLCSQYESFGSAAAEAATAGVPVVVSEACGVAPLLSTHGAALTFRTGDVGDLARQLTRLRDDGTERRRLRDAGLGLREILDARHTARLQIEIYDDVLRHHRA